MSGTVALDEVAVVVDGIIIRYIVGECLTGEYQWVVDINMRLAPIGSSPNSVLLVVVYTEVRSKSYLEVLVQAGVDAGVEGRALHGRLVDKTLLLVVVVRQIVVNCLATALHSGVNVVSRSIVAQNFLVPVGTETVLTNQITYFIAYWLTDEVAELDVLLRVHHLGAI